MSRLFEALSGLKTELRATEVATPHVVAPPPVLPPAPKQEMKTEYHSLQVVPQSVSSIATGPPHAEHDLEELIEPAPKPSETEEMPGLQIYPSAESKLVALTDANSLGAEKFRALVTRFDHLRNKRELRSLQVTSSVINEGKTLVAGNVAVTFAKYSGCKTLLVEGDLHRPTLANLFGLSELPGISHWWSGQYQELGQFVRRLGEMPLWFLPAGKPCDQPSDLLRSARFQKAFAQLASQFEWIVVDSTPMLPIVDVNLWSRLVDGTVLVVREGITPVKELKRGLQALDHPKLIGVVVNDATEFDQVNYDGQYYGVSDRPEKLAKHI
jgi:capsular exopolysaccharide synthesis family protein